MPFEFQSLSHGPIAFDFIKIESDTLLLDHYFFLRVNSPSTFRTYLRERKTIPRHTSGKCIILNAPPIQEIV
jgi:hypothetical protein